MPRPAGGPPKSSPLTLFGGFAVITALSIYAFRGLAQQRATPLQPGQERKAKDYRQY